MTAPESEEPQSAEFKRTKPVPLGHCPEPIIEIKSCGSPRRWDRALVWEPNERGGCSFTTAHSLGGCDKGNWRMVQEYGDKIMDDAADLRLPWSLAQLKGKYYGTKVLDADGEEVAEFWDHSVAAHPSVREKASFGEWTETAWADYCCDSHWESERDYVRALAIVNAMNATRGPHR